MIIAIDELDDTRRDLRADGRNFVVRGGQHNSEADGTVITRVEDTIRHNRGV